MTARYRVVVTHGESATLYQVVDTAQPENEQPCVVRSWSTANTGAARYLADDFCIRHNRKETA